MFHLYSYSPHGLDSVPRQLLVNVIDILGELGGNVECVRLVGYGCQDVQLQGLNVAGLILPAVECGVDLRTR